LWQERVRAEENQGERSPRCAEQAGWGRFLATEACNAWMLGSADSASATLPSPAPSYAAARQGVACVAGTADGPVAGVGARSGCGGGAGPVGACLAVRTPPAALFSTTHNRERLERRGFVDPPRGAGRNNLDDDHFQIDGSFIRQEVYAPGALHAPGARGGAVP